MRPFAYSLLADAVLLLHAAFIAWAVFGALAVARWRWLALAHLPALAWAAWVSWSGAVCPLTPLENHLRRRAGEGGYAGGFIEHYLGALIYPAGLTPRLQLVFGAVLLAANLVLYAVLLARAAARQRRIA